MNKIDLMCRKASRKLAGEIEARAEAAKLDLSTAFQRLRRSHNLPPIALSSWKWHRLPVRFICPECAGRLIFEIDEWSTTTGIPTAGGIRVMCESEENELWRAMQRDEDPAWEHRGWQSDWMPVVRSVERFCASRVRVYG